LSQIPPPHRESTGPSQTSHTLERAESETALAPLLARQGLACLPYFGLATGLLTVKDRPAQMSRAPAPKERPVHAASPAALSGRWEEQWPANVLRLRDPYAHTRLSLRIFDASPEAAKRPQPRGPAPPVAPMRPLRCSMLRLLPPGTPLKIEEPTIPLPQVVADDLAEL
jgi:hypothetical protein